jgi:hypothetical protein
MMLAALLVGMGTALPGLEELVVTFVPAEPVTLLALDEVWVDAVTEGPAIVLQLDTFKDTNYQFPLLDWPVVLTSAAGQSLTIDNVSMTLVSPGEDDLTTSPPMAPTKSARATDGYMEVRFGYRIDVAPGQPPGTYSGTFAIEVESTRHETGIVPAQITVSVDVIAPISVTVQDFDAGIIAPGESVNVLPWHPEAGRVEVTGEPGAQVDVVYSQVPGSIVNTTGGQLSTGFTVVAAHPTTGSCESESVQLVEQGGQSTGTLPATPGLPWVLCFGGWLYPPQLTEPGVYSGVLSLTLQYPGSDP